MSFLYSNIIQLTGAPPVHCSQYHCLVEAAYHPARGAPVPIHHPPLQQQQGVHHQGNESVAPAPPALVEGVVMGCKSKSVRPQQQLGEGSGRHAPQTAAAAAALNGTVSIKRLLSASV